MHFGYSLLPKALPIVRVGYCKKNAFLKMACLEFMPLLGSMSMRGFVVKLPVSKSPQKMSGSLCLKQFFTICSTDLKLSLIIVHFSGRLESSTFYFKCMNVVGLKVHKIENFFGSDFEFCGISLLVMLKY
jgi:hypothetical protein